MHQKYIGLIELIKSLSSVEKTYFKKFKAFENDDSKQLQLFDLCVKHEHLDVEEIENKAIRTFTKKGFLQLKKLLFHSICDVMCYYHKDKEGNIKLYHEVQKINFLIARNLKKEAAKYAYNLKQQLYDTPNLSLIPVLHSKENFLYLEEDEFDNFSENLIEYFKVVEVMKGIEELNDTRIYTHSVSLLDEKEPYLSDKNISAIKSIMDYYEKKYSINSSFVSKQAEMNHLMGSLIKEKTLNEKMGIAVRQFELIQNNPNVFTVDSKLYNYYMLISLSIMLKRHEKSEFYINELENYSTNSQVKQKKKYEMLYLMQLKYAASKNDFKKIKEIVNKYITEKKSFKFKFSKIYDTEITHNLLFANIFTSDVENNKKLIIKYATADLRKNNSELFEVYRVLEILNLIELEDFDAVTYKIRNAKLSFKGKPDLYELLRILEKVKNKLEIFDKKDIEPIVDELTSLYQTHYQNANSHLVFANFDLSEWGQLKLNGL